jgi:hypothetical protein
LASGHKYEVNTMVVLSDIDSPSPTDVIRKWVIHPAFAHAHEMKKKKTLSRPHRGVLKRKSPHCFCLLYLMGNRRERSARAPGRFIFL